MFGSMGPIGPGIPKRIPVTAVVDILLGNIAKWSGEPYEIIIMEIRLPRVLLACLVGSALAVAGTVMQGFFRNPMADPYVIGMSSGAGVGAALNIVLGIGKGLGTLSLPVMAFLGGILTIFLVYNLARVGGTVRVETLLLAGIAVASFLAAIIGLLLYFAGYRAHELLFWLMGGLWKSSWDAVIISFPIILVCVVILCFFARDLNAMSLGDEPATHLGIDIKTVKKLLLALSALVVSVAVAFSGIIGFVGLIIPHMMRILIGPNHRTLLPVSALTGGIFLIWADVFAKTVISPTEIPVGIITALCGAPFFIYLLRKRRQKLM
jgi:iron complex transport system permease protein